ncbi:DUF892 family protein [Sinomicrobium pectinilyticum]|uniref:DUF892 family protein n=1 Tax=Sinomicrobium pectinilyticum TaxID=1084421 RepID=A0A3N0DHY6_SINP1|nr:DUF892 family protein [Sinomicrobium pectinilyticum]RNL75297.1 DUF892 family protein [Sinomicrobium pectinilyticum]
MNNTLGNLRELFVQQSLQLFDTTMREQSELPYVAKNISTPELKELVQKKLRSSKDTGDFLQEVFHTMEIRHEVEKGIYCECILTHAEALIDRSKDPYVCDAVILNALQQLCHNNIASLGSLASYAREIGQKEIAFSFEGLSAEEGNIDKELARLAKHSINRKASFSIM